MQRWPLLSSLPPQAPVWQRAPRRLPHPPVRLLPFASGPTRARRAAHSRRRHMTQPSASATLVELDPSDLKLTRVRAMRGPNYWRLAPVITADLELGALETISSAEMPDFTERLLAAMP